MINNKNVEELDDNELSSLLSPINSSSSQQLLSSPKNESKQTQNSFNNLIKNINDSQNSITNSNSKQLLLLNELNENNSKCIANEIISDNNINNNLLLNNLCHQTINKNIKRIQLDEQKLNSLNINDLKHYWSEQELYINWIESQLKQFNRDKCDLISLRESEEKLKQQQLEANRRENILVMRLTTKEQEMQEYLNQIQELKQSQVPSNAQLQSTLIDPAVNLMFEKMKQEVDSSRAKVEEMQSELNAWKFTPDSTTGKRLMAKCRLLYQENEELGKMIASGRIAKLEGELALQKNFSEEMKKSQSELDEFLLELDEDVEGMQNTIYYLQQQLKEAKEKLAQLENTQQNDCVLQNNSNNLDNNMKMSSQLSTNIESNERTFEIRAEVSDTHREKVDFNNGPNFDINDYNENNETLDSVESNDDYYVEKSSVVSERDVQNENSINNNNNYLSLVNNSTNNLNNNECNNKRTSCFDDDYKEPIGKVAKLNTNEDSNSCGNTSTKQLIINDNSQHSNDMTCSESLTTLQNNCIEINGQLNQ